MTDDAAQNEIDRIANGSHALYLMLEALNKVSRANKGGIFFQPVRETVRMAHAVISMSDESKRQGAYGRACGVLSMLEVVVSESSAPPPGRVAYVAIVGLTAGILNTNSGKWIELQGPNVDEAIASLYAAVGL